jgi:uncharacterized protein (TIGR03118 family)
MSQSAWAQNAFLQRNLVSDVPGLAARTDTNLVNPWGIAFSATSPFWIADNHSGRSTLYNGDGVPQALVVNVPSPAGFAPLGAPTGIVFNSTTNFTVGSNAPARFIFSTEDGTIAGWNSGTNAVLKVDNSAGGAIYKGLAIGTSGGATYIYATDFHNGKIDVFDSDYGPVALAGAFVDPSIPAGFAPFGIQNIHGQLVVTYAMQDVDKVDDLPGPGHGYVDVFTTSGQLVHQLVATGVLNSPWGLTLAPAGFGPFGGALLVGNFGDGQINAFDFTTGTSMGTMKGTNSAPVQVNGLWALTFGNGGNGGDAHTLYFTAGISGGGVTEDHGLFGSLTPASPSFISIADRELFADLNWAGGVGPFLLQKKADLSDSSWVDVLTTGNRSMPIVKDTSAGVFRVAAQTSKTVLPFTALLNGASEIPAKNTDATGLGTFSLEGSNLTYNINFFNLSAPATGAHIHAPADATLSTNVAVPFSVAPVTSGTISGTVGLAPDLVADIVGGLAYVNIHTTNNPGGEIRGQIVPLHIQVPINGASQVPAIQTAASGSASLTLVGSEMFYKVSFSGLSGPATGAHIHGPADSTTNANVIIPFSPPAAASGTFSGSVALSPPQMAYLLAGQTYINIHTATNAGGEIRGQIYPVQFGAALDGASEVPATTSSGTGTGTMTLVSNVLAYNVSFTNLLSAATAGHIHGPADTTHNANVLVPFSVPPATEGTISGFATLSSQQLLDLVSGLTYANIHTTNYPLGEIRGQVLPRN